MPLTARFTAIRLLSAAIHADVHMTHSSAVSIESSIRVYHLHGLRIAAVQPIGSTWLDQRPRRIQTDDSLDPEVQIVGQHATQMSAQRVANACRLGHRHPRAAQETEVLGQTACHRFQIVYGRHIARSRTKITPVDHEHVVVAVIYVRYLCIGMR